MINKLKELIGKDDYNGIDPKDAMEVYNALPKLLQIIEIQREALEDIYDHKTRFKDCSLEPGCGCAQTVVEQALQEVERIEDE